MSHSPEIIDAFCHWLPQPYLEYVDKVATGNLHMFTRARQIETMVSLEARFRVMDEFPGYRQIPSLSSPSVEMLADKDGSPDLARCANDVMSEIVARYPDRFPGFVGALPLNNPEACVQEMLRAPAGAAGFQIFTSINGQPLDDPEFDVIFRCASENDITLWMHPIGGLNTPDYRTEKISKYDLWWSLGWPHETSKAMGRLIFSGKFENYRNLRIITHHAGGTIPMMEGRLNSGMSVTSQRTPAELREADLVTLTEPPIDTFRRFYADTATFGGRAALECGMAFFGLEHMLFASDMPFDPEGGPGYIRSTLQCLSQIPLSDTDKTAVFSGNIRRIAKLGA